MEDGSLFQGIIYVELEDVAEVERTEVGVYGNEIDGGRILKILEYYVNRRIRNTANGTIQLFPGLP